MFNWLKQLWQKILNWFAPKPEPPPPPEPSDLEYQTWLEDVLAQVAQGSTWSDLQAFLIIKNIKKNKLAQWLKKFGAKLASQETQPDAEWVRRLALLGKVAQGDLGRAAQQVAQRFTPPAEEPEAISSSGRDEFDLSGATSSGDETTGESKVEQVSVSGEASTAADVQISSEVKELLVQWLQQYQAGDLQGALVSATRATELQPDFHEAWNGRGIALNYLGRYEEAVACFDQALQIQP
ncbi:MAG: tetratricopeptide repeat protein, partial [Oscillatoria sp. PMC 1050.18]|nr:tetratricopeptide repeat protein [Oscillatoria sp. PMC 1050.18]